jgi:hypothetical protein
MLDCGSFFLPTAQRLFVAQKLILLSDQDSNDITRRMKPANRGTVKSMSPCAGL